MLSAPVPVTHKLLERTGMKVDEFDAVECNEAFAAIALMWQREFDYPMERFNPRGGAIALGHPLGACGVALMTRCSATSKHRRPLRLPDHVRGRRPSQRHRHRARLTSTVTPAEHNDGAEGGELLLVVRGGVVHEADVDRGGTGRRHSLDLFADALGLAGGVERAFVLQHDLDRIRCGPARPRWCERA